MTNMQLLPDPKSFAHSLHGKATHLITLQNSNGMRLALTDYGARIVAVIVPDRFDLPTDFRAKLPHIHILSRSPCLVFSKATGVWPDTKRP